MEERIGFINGSVELVSEGNIIAMFGFIILLIGLIGSLWVVFSSNDEDKWTWNNPNCRGKR
jgi:hypothetical protein